MNFIRAALPLWLCIESLAFAFVNPMKPPTASSGNWVGNGGVIAICDIGSEKKSAALLDLVEIVPETFTPDYADGSLMEQVNAYIDRLADFIPDRVSFYRRLADDFLKKVRFKKDLIETNDTATAVLPPNCRTVQAVVQFGIETPEKNLYYVYRTAWDALDTRNLAILILHEILYYEANSLGHMNNSTSVRRFVRAVVGNEFKTRTLEDFRAFMRSIKLATEIWKDPVANRDWFLTVPALEDSPAWIVDSCARLTRGHLPTSEEFKEAASSLFASQEAIFLYPNADSLGFWVKDSDRDGIYVLDRFGVRLQTDSFGYIDRPKIKFCVSGNP